MVASTRRFEVTRQFVDATSIIGGWGICENQRLHLCTAATIRVVWIMRQALRAITGSLTSIICGVLVLLAAGGMVLGQAGSTGGTLGKTDKSASGEQQSSAPHGKAPLNTHVENPAAQTPSCGNIVGTWNWPNGGVMAFYKDGTAGTAGQPPGGTWRCSGSTVVAVFNNGGRDQYIVAPDGNSLSLTTNWIPGNYTATRKN